MLTTTGCQLIENGLDGIIVVRGAGRRGERCRGGSGSGGGGRGGAVLPSKAGGGVGGGGGRGGELGEVEERVGPRSQERLVELL